MSSAAALTERHRLAQLGVRAAALRDFLRLWPLWTGDTASFASLVQATIPLVTVYRQSSAALAAGYYQAFRAAAAAAGAPAVRLAAPATAAQLTAAMYATGQVTTRDALAAGQAAAQARKTALVRTSGAVTRLVLNAGRETILDSVAADERALGWARVTDGNPCAFCLMLASRGAVYKSEQTAGFQAHDHCGCTAVPIYDGSPLPANTSRWKRIYNAAQRDGEKSGYLQPGENPSSLRLNAVRRYLAAQPVSTS